MELPLDLETSDVFALRSLKRKDSSALRALLTKYESPLIGYLTSLTHDRGLAEDLVQETFLRLIRRPPLRAAKGSLKPWLFKVARNLALDHQRKQSRIELRSELPEPHPDDPTKLDAGDTKYLLQCLTPEMKQIVALRIFGDFTFKEISKQLGLPLGTVLWRMSNAVKIMRETLEAEEK